MPAPRWVTLTTDFGSVYSAQLKAVLATEAPLARVVELSSELPAHGIEEAAFLLAHMARGFPRGTTHLAVVDPGVGTDRAPIVIRCPGGTHLVGPDNGLLAPLAEFLGGGTGFRIDRARVPGPVRPSATFDGRDLFAPAATLLARGRSVRGFAVPHPYRRFELPTAERVGTRIEGVVVHVDRFGNLISNVPADWAQVGDSLRVRVGSAPARRLKVVRTYDDLAVGGVGVLASSFGTLEVSARSFSAARRLRAASGGRIRLDPGGRPSKYSGR